MERTGTRVIAGIADDDLVDLVGHPGPFLSVYLPLERAAEHAAQQNEVRWGARRAEVEDALPAAMLDAVDEIVRDAHHTAAAIAVIATGDTRLVESVEAALVREGSAVAGPVPRLGPLIASRQRAVPHVVALVDRRGADLVAVPARGRSLGEEVDLEDRRPERKVGPGGWSQRRFQQRAENRWEEGAEAVADEVTGLVDRVGARLLVLGGDDRNVGALEDALGARVPEVVRLTREGRKLGSETDLEDRLRRSVHDVAARDTVAVLEKLREELGQHDRATEGPEPTLAALGQGQVDVLLVHDDPADERRAWFDPRGSQVAPSRADLEALGVDEPVEARLVDVAVRAALLTGASVWVVPEAGGPEGCLGALLRWS